MQKKYKKEWYKHMKKKKHLAVFNKMDTVTMLQSWYKEQCHAICVEHHNCKMFYKSNENKS